MRGALSCCLLNTINVSLIFNDIKTKAKIMVIIFGRMHDSVDLSAAISQWEKHVFVLATVFPIISTKSFNSMKKCAESKDPRSSLVTSR